VPRATRRIPLPVLQHRKRFRHHKCDYRYVRKVHGYKYQARLWVGGRLDGHSINLGLYDQDALAYRAVLRVLAKLFTPGRVPTPLDVWAVMKPLLAEGQLPPHLLPKYAVRRPDGLFDGKVTKRGRRHVVGPFADPAHATAAVLGLLAGLPQSNTPRGY
jgi:hypothetical protein